METKPYLEDLKEDDCSKACTCDLFDMCGDKSLMPEIRILRKKNYFTSFERDDKGQIPYFTDVFFFDMSICAR